MQPEFIVYTDGASRKDGRGGWGYAVWYDECWWEDCGGTYDTTNNRMELQGVISALSMIDSFAENEERIAIQLWADSQYVLMGISEYIDDWKLRNWRTSGNKPVKNRDLWEILDELVQRHDIDWQWVKGHTGVEGNERADTLATRGVPPERQSAANARAARVRMQRRTVRGAGTDATDQGRIRG